MEEWKCKEAYIIFLFLKIIFVTSLEHLTLQLICILMYFEMLYDNALRKLYGVIIQILKKKKKKMQEKVPFKFWTRDSIKRNELNQGTGNSIIKFHEISRSRSARIDFFLSLSFTRNFRKFNKIARMWNLLCYLLCQQYFIKGNYAV